MTSSPQAPDARELAADLLAHSRARGPFIADLFDELAEASGLDPRDRRLAYELAAGVVRHRRTLDCVLAGYSNRRVERLAPPLRLLLRLGAYQLLFLERVPQHAAVDRTVELGKRWAPRKLKKRAASIGGFINGVLRSLVAAMTPLDSAKGQERRRLIERPGGERFVLLDRDVLADPAGAPADHLAEAFSFNDYLAARWVKQYRLAGACDIARAQNRRPAMTLRVNTLLSDSARVRELLAGEGVQARAIPARAPMLRVTDGDALGSRAFREGLFQPQDALAAAVVEQMSLKEGLTVLDRCAAPGTKTTQIVEAMHDRGRVLAVDVSEEGLERLRTNCKRMGGHIVKAFGVEQMPERLLEVRHVDRVLVDAPCSNSGVLARRPEARWRISEKSVRELALLQRELLMDGLNWLTPGGRCVYSTCSIEPEENEQVVKYAVNRREGEVRLMHDRLTLPSLVRDHDGGYFAVLERVR